MELRRSMKSISGQVGVVALTCVVVNGNRVDSELLEEISGLPNVLVLRIDTAGISIARLEGRRSVETPYFLFLDDDDELCPNALGELLSTFNANDSDTGLVIADAYNDYRQSNYGFVPSASAIEQDPLSTLLDQNWFIAQSALFKTELVPEYLFDIHTKSNECTMIAFNLALLNIKIRVNQQVLAIIHDKPDSESKTEHFITEETAVVRWMLSNNAIPIMVRRKLRRKLAACLHNNSIYYLERRRFGKSIWAHFTSLLVPGGARYFLYGRHILRGMVKK